MNKKAISIFLTAAMCPLYFGNVYGAESDISSHWSKDSFLRLGEMKIINGYNDGTYRPDAKITRAEFYKIINTTANVSKNDGSLFSDVSDDAWYKNTIDKAFTSKYASGYDDGTFKPEANITRVEAAAAICKAFGGDTGETHSFSDDDKIPEWAKPAVNTLASAGILSGYEDGSFRPDQYITRAETAAIFDKFVGVLYTQSVNLSDSSFDKTVIIGATDVIFTNVVFEKDIYIGPAVSGGEIRFINCTLNGNIYAAGRNGAGVVLENTNAGKLCINSTDSQNVVLTGSSVVDNVVLRSQCSLMEMNADKGAKVVTAYTNAELSGTFDEVNICGGNGINLVSGSIKQLNVNAEGVPEIESAGKIESVNAKTAAVVNGSRISAGTVTDNIENKNKNIQYSYTVALMNGEISDTDPSLGGTRTDTVAETDCVLSGLTLSAGTLSPAFSPNVTEYRVLVPYSAGSISIVPVVDGLTEIKVNGKTVNDKGYTIEELTSPEQSVEFELYSELVKKNTYTVTVSGYGTDDTTLASASLNVPYEETKVDNTYKLKLKGNIDYSSGRIPVTLTLTSANPNSTIKIDGTECSSKEFDLYKDGKIFVNAEVISEDNSCSSTYEITLERDRIPEIDNADSGAVETILSSPDAMTMELLEKAKITGAKESKLDKYRTYLAKIAYHADGVSLEEQQLVIQKAIDVVNEYDGKIIRLEAEDYFKGEANQIRAFLDDASGKAVNMSKDISAELELPEGEFIMSVRSAGAYWQKRLCEIQLNGTTVYSQNSGGSFGQAANDLNTSKFAVVSQNVSVSEGKNVLTILRKDNLYCDYVDLEMLF